MLVRYTALIATIIACGGFLVVGDTRVRATEFHGTIHPIAGNPAYRNGGSGGTSERLVDDTGPANTCVQACQARYLDCQRLGQLPDFQCRGIYEDCATNTCGMPPPN